MHRRKQVCQPDTYSATGPPTSNERKASSIVAQDFLQMKRIQPESKATYRLSGIIKSDFKDYYGCIIDLSIFLKSDTTDLDVWKTRAFCRSLIKDYVGSTEDYRQAIELRPNDMNSYAQICRNNLLRTDTVAAMKNLIEMDAHWPNTPDIQFSIAELLVQTRKYDSASMILTRLLKTISVTLIPGLKSNALFLNAQVLVAQSSYNKALNQVSEAIELDQNNLNKIFYRARLSLKMGKVKDAQKDLRDLRAQQFAPATEYYKKYLEN